MTVIPLFSVVESGDTFYFDRDASLIFRCDACDDFNNEDCRIEEFSVSTINNDHFVIPFGNGESFDTYSRDFIYEYEFSAAHLALEYLVLDLGLGSYSLKGVTLRNKDRIYANCTNIPRDHEIIFDDTADHALLMFHCHDKFYNNSKDWYIKE